MKNLPTKKTGEDIEEAEDSEKEEVPESKLETDAEELVAQEEEPEEDRAFLEPILPGESTVMSNLSPMLTNSDSFGFGGPDRGMENIGEGAEEEETASKADPNEDKEVEDLPIHGLRISTTSVSVDPPAPGPLSISSSAASFFSPPPSSSDLSGLASAKTSRRGSFGREGSRQVRDPGNPLFPGSFASLTVKPNLVGR